MARAGKSSGGESGTQSPTMGSSFIPWFFQPAMLFRMSLIAGACAFWPYVLQKLPSLGTRPEYRISFAEIQVIPAPTDPVPGNLVEQVADQSGMPRELSLLNESLTVEIAQAFRRHPWVSKVIRVRKSFPAAIVVELEYRKPVVMAQVQGGRIPLDAHGVVLPTSDFSTRDTNRFPLIQNVDNKPKVRPGNIWNDPGILAATRLADLLGEHWKALKLEAISLSRVTGSATDSDDVILELIGKGGSKIVWGRAPGSDHPGELEAMQKVRRLEKYLVDYGDYSHPQGPYEIDIRHWQEISRRPLVAEQAQAKPAKSQKPTSKGKIDAANSKLREAKSLKAEPRK
jgi:hypothetical protein